MTSRISGAVPNSLLTQKSRSGSRSKSAKGNGQIQHGEQMSHSKSLAGNRGIMQRGHNEMMHDQMNHLQIQNNSQSIGMGVGRVGGLAMASISSHNLAINKSNDLNRRVSQSPYSFQTKLNNQINSAFMSLAEPLGGKAQTSLNVINTTKNLEDAERRYQELFEAEKQRLQKKEQDSKEMISKISKKLKVQEKKSKDESRVAMELRKHYEQQKNKADKLHKDKSQIEVQLKKLLSQFLVQRKALEVSIGKNKRMQEELSQIKAKQMEHDESKKMHTRQVENFEEEIGSLKSRFRKEKESLEAELQEKRHTVQRQAAEIKDLNSKISNFRVREEEYETKIKGLWSDQEKKSKAYQKDIQSIHENYRGVTSQAAEMEARLTMYKSDWEKATQDERTARQEVLKLTFQSDEMTERHRYMERKYLQLVQRVGASAEDLEAVEIIMANAPDKSGKKPYPQVNKDRIPSRHDKQRQDHNDNQAQYYLFGDQKGKEQHSHQRGPSDRGQKTNIVEVLEFDQEVQQPAGNLFYSQKDHHDDDENHRHQNQVASINSNQVQNAALLQVNDSGDLLKKLIDNIQNNHSLQNESVRARFKLQLIEKEEDLHRYKNLLNAMAALFYTNHRMKDVTGFFGQWRQLALEIQKKEQDQARKRQIEHSIESPPDMKSQSREVRHQDEFMSDSYNQQPTNARFSIDPDDKLGNAVDMSGSDREHISLSSDNSDNPKNNVLDDTDAKVDKAAKRFIDALRKVGPHSKHILNYSYPPLLYQRGDDEEDDDEESADQGECDEDEDDTVPNSQDIEGDGMGQLPEFHDSDDDELIALGGALDHPNTKDDQDVEQDEDFMNQLKAVEQDDNGYYDSEQVDHHGDVKHLHDYDEEHGSSQGSGGGVSGLEGVEGLHMTGEDGEFSDDEMGIVGGHATNLDGLDKDQIMKMIEQEADGLGFDPDDEEVDLEEVERALDYQLEDDDIGDQEMFNQHLMEAAEEQNRGQHRQRQSHGGEQHDSTIINSSQNTSLEQNFMHGNQE